MDYQKLWFSLKEEFIEFRNKEDIAVNDLIEKMDKMEITEFKISKSPEVTLLCEDSTKNWTDLNDMYKCNICGGEIYYTGINAIQLPIRKEYKCKKCCNVILK